MAQRNRDAEPEERIGSQADARRSETTEKRANLWSVDRDGNKALDH